MAERQTPPPLLEPLLDTPIRRNCRPQGTNRRASFEHAVSERAVHSERMDHYIDLACAFIDRRAWDSIVANIDVVNALQDVVDVAELDAAKDPGFHEEAYYGPTVKLLNVISRAVFKALGMSADTDVACIFASNADAYPPGDLLDLRYRPDYHGFFGPHTELELAICEALYSRIVCWPEIGLVGEQKRRLASYRGQLKTYATTAGRYRPDLPTILGFLIHHGKVQLSQLNASGMWSSGAVKVGEIKAWVALVVLVYKSYQQRDQKLVYNAQQEEFVRWDFTDTAPAPAPAPALEDDTAPAGVTSSTKPLVLAPFYAASAPGRVTFASYEVASGSLSTEDAADAFYDGEVRGFWKTSWQQKGRSQERELLDRLHAGGWLPGLVRPYPGTPGDRLQVPTPNDIIRRAHTEADKRKLASEDRSVDAIERTAGNVDAVVEPMNYSEGSTTSSGYDSAYTFDEDEEDDEDAEDAEDADSVNDMAFLPCLPDNPPDYVTRYQEIIHLASIGEPVSQCSTPRELLQLAYDLLQVHIHMWDQGVLHRDISWFNVLFKPRHYIAGDVQEKPQPCIRQILHGLAPEDACSETSSEVDLSPTVLLTDLDHAIDKNLLKPVNDDGRERTGTAMFISFELSDHTASRYSHLAPPAWTALVDALTSVELQEHGLAALDRAFPNGDGDFMTKFNEVRVEEGKRLDYASLLKRPVHNPRHDAESIYWLFLYAFARARPRDAPPETDQVRIDNLAAFCGHMLDHEVGNEKDRLQYLENDLRVERLFHPSLSVFEGLFKAMAAYLCIPWHLYQHIVEPDHVHIAFRRMILGYLLRLDAETLDRKLDTENPRRADQPKGKSAERLNSAWSASISSVGGSGRASVHDAMPPLPAAKAPKAPKPTIAPAPATPVPAPGPVPVASSSADVAGMAPPATLVSGSSTASRKRKAADPGAKGAPPKKRPKARKPSRSKVKLSPEELARRARQADKYVHKLHYDQRCAHALRLKAWKDRRFWFSKGV